MGIDSTSGTERNSHIRYTMNKSGRRWDGVGDSEGILKKRGHDFRETTEV